MKNLVKQFPIDCDVDKEGILAALTKVEIALWGSAREREGLILRVANIERAMSEKQAGLGLRARIDALEYLLVRLADLESKMKLTPEKSRGFESRLEAMEKRKSLTPEKDDSFQKRIGRLEKALP